MLKPRRQPRFGGAHLCATIAALLLLISVSLLYNRLGSFHLHLVLQPADTALHQSPPSDVTSAVHILADEDPDLRDDINGDDRIDELDRLDEETEPAVDVVQTLGEGAAADFLDDSRKVKNIGLFWDHVTGVARRSFDQRSISEEWFGFDSDSSNSNDPSKTAFASDDQPLDVDIRMKLDAIRSIEDALLLKTDRRPSILKDGWASWFEKKGDFLRKDRMFRSNLEVLNPLNNPLLQDPDMPGVTVLTRGDKIMQKALWRDIEKTPFDGSGSDTGGNGNVGGRNIVKVKRIGRRILGEIAKNVVNQDALIYLGSNTMADAIAETRPEFKQQKMSI